MKDAFPRGTDLLGHPMARKIAHGNNDLQPNKVCRLKRPVSNCAHRGAGYALSSRRRTDPVAEIRPLVGGVDLIDSAATHVASICRDDGKLERGPMTERLKVFDLLTRFTWYPSLTVDGRQRVNYKLDIDFNLPGDWYWRIGLFENYDNRPPAGLSKNDYGWSNAFGLKF